MIGTDPEFVIVRRDTGESVPAHKFFPSKDAKLVVPLTDYPGHRYQVNAGTPEEVTKELREAKLFRDGYMLEVNVPPMNCRAYLAGHMRQALEAAYKVIGPEYRLSAAQAVQIDLATMKDAPDDVRQFGCEPSYCAYTGATKVPPIDAMTHPWRYAGGHMHFSALGASTEPENHTQTIRLLDQFVGLPLTAIFGGPLSVERRKFYGQAGEYRSQKYPDGTQGVEYRTPGPEVWTDWTVISSFAFGIAKRILGAGYEEYCSFLDSTRFDAVREAINSAPEKAWDLIIPVEHFYDKETLQALKAKVTSAVNLNEMPIDVHAGFSEIAYGEWGVPVPGYKGMKFRRSSDVARVNIHSGGFDVWLAHEKRWWPSNQYVGRALNQLNLVNNPPTEA